jgi:hypothetical protein
MTGSTEKLDVDRILRSLKRFQRTTVSYVFERFWGTKTPWTGSWWQMRPVSGRPWLPRA